MEKTMDEKKIEITEKAIRKTAGQETAFVNMLNQEVKELQANIEVEKMAKCICPSYERKTDCETCPTEWCYAEECGTMLFCNGYRKESDTAREILTELLRVKSVEGWEENEQLVQFVENLVDKIEELEDRYGVKLTEDNK